MPLTAPREAQVFNWIIHNLQANKSSLSLSGVSDRKQIPTQFPFLIVLWDDIGAESNDWGEDSRVVSLDITLEYYHKDNVQSELDTLTAVTEIRNHIRTYLKTSSISGVLFGMTTFGSITRQETDSENTQKVSIPFSVPILCDETSGT